MNVSFAIPSLIHKMITGWKLIRLGAICSLISIICNFAPAVLNSSVNTAVQEFRLFIRDSYQRRGWDISEETELLIRSVLLNSWFVSQFIGAVTLSWLAEKYGRLKTFQLSIGIMALGSSIQFLASLFYLPELFLAGRFLTGVFSPLADVATVMYLNESPPMEMRGKFSYLSAIFYSMLAALGMLLGMRSVLGYSFSLLLGIQLPPMFLSLIFLFFCLPDTPPYLMINKQDRKAALKSLEFFQGKKEENEKLIGQYVLEATNLVKDPQSPATIKELLTIPHMRMTTLIAGIVYIFVLPPNTLLHNSTYIFETIGIEPSIAELSSTIMFIIYGASCITGAMIIDRFPRRTLLLSFGWASTLFLALFVLFSNASAYVDWLKYASLGSIFLFMASFNMVLGPMSWFLCAELVTQRYRSLIFAFCYGLCNVMITLTNSACLLMFREIGSLVFIPLYILPYMVTLLFLQRYLPESKGRESFEVAEVIRLMSANKVSLKQAEALYAGQKSGQVNLAASIVD